MREQHFAGITYVDNGGESDYRVRFTPGVHVHVEHYWREIPGTRGSDGLPMLREHCRCGATRECDGWGPGAIRGKWKEKENA